MNPSPPPERVEGQVSVELSRKEIESLLPSDYEAMPRTKAETQNKLRAALSEDAEQGVEGT